MIRASVFTRQSVRREPHPVEDQGVAVAYPSRFFLIDGTPFTSRDWSRLEVKKGVLRKGMSAAAWVCADGKVVVDWRPAMSFTGRE